MKQYFFIGMGGFLGAIARFAIENIRIVNIGEQAIWNTLIINVAGCFLISVFITAAVSMLAVDEAIRLGVTKGLLGAFTTFSTVCKESFNLGAHGYYFLMFMYPIISCVLGLAAIILGILALKKLMHVIMLRITINDTNKDQSCMSLSEAELNAEGE
ncbi:MAG: CrcB family protein [Clostridia bacterium]|nr:CrcB family protein [Clostridia bacterium]